MIPRFVIVISVDCLHRGFLGVYGNAAAETPSLDTLSCQSDVADRFYVNNTDPHATLARWWQQDLKDTGIHTTLITDDANIGRRDSTSVFDDVHHCTMRIPTSPCHDADETHTARFFREMMTPISHAMRHRRSLIWCHFSGLGRCWDVPMAWRERYGDEGDPPPFAEVVPPWSVVDNKSTVFDEIQSTAAAYTAAVSLLDESLGECIDLWSQSGLLDETLLVIVSTRGLPMGEHGTLGVPPEDSNASLLWSETLHTPLLIRHPGQTSPRRLLSLCDTSDLGIFIASAARGEEIEQVVTAAPRAIHLTSPGERGLVTDEWFFRKNTSGKLETPPQLYVKPDDRWEVNDVANRCDEVVAQLGAIQ